MDPAVTEGYCIKLCFSSGTRINTRLTVWDEWLAAVISMYLNMYAGHRWILWQLRILLQCYSQKAETAVWRRVFYQTIKPLQVSDESFLSSSALWSGLAHSVGAEGWAYVYRFTYVRHYQSYTWVSIGHLVFRDLGQSLTAVFFTFNIKVSQQWEQRRGNSARVVSHRYKNITFFPLQNINLNVIYCWRAELLVSGSVHTCSRVSQNKGREERVGLFVSCDVGVSKNYPEKVHLTWVLCALTHTNTWINLQL